MTGTRSSRGVIPQVCVLRCVAVCGNVYDDWDPLFAWCDPTGMCVAFCSCCTVLHCMKTCTMTGTVLHCIAVHENVYDVWYCVALRCTMLHWLHCVKTITITGTRSLHGVILQVCMLQCVAVCCGVLHCVETFTMTGTRSSRGVIPQVCVLRCVAVCCGVLRCVAVGENVYDDWDPPSAWCDPTGMCVACCCCCTVLHCVKTCTMTGTVLHCIALCCTGCTA